jgi:AcrR family transcriptional regulator
LTVEAVADRATRVRHADRSQATREAILLAAEQLLAEGGLDNVSHRQISAAAGQGNVAAVNYHFGTTTDLVRAIVARHALAIERLRLPRLDSVRGSTDIAAWLSCVVHPIAEHLEALGSPTWWARFSGQLLTDPQYRCELMDGVMGLASLQEAVQGLMACLPNVPDHVRAERRDMTRLLAVHVFAEREAALARGLPTARDDWRHCADGLVDAAVGLWLAPVGSHGR